MTETRDTGAPRWLTAAALAVVLVIAGGVFRIVYLADDRFRGRDVGHHVEAFLRGLGRYDAPLDLASFAGSASFDYAWVFQVATIPFRYAFGTHPTSFAALSLLLLAAALVLAASFYRRAGLSPASILLLGLLLVSSRMFLRIFTGYDIDGLYMVSILLVCGALFVDDPDRRPDPLLLLVLTLLCAGTRPTTAIYLAVPFLYALVRFARARSGGTRAPDPARPRWRAALWIAAAGLLVADLWFYVPRIEWLGRAMTESPNFDFASRQVAGGLWTWDNWGWFIRHADDAGSLALGLVLLPFAAWAWWRLFRGRRAFVLAFCVVPWVGYSFVLGTRKTEYLAPSAFVFLWLAVAGIAMIPRLRLRVAATALVVVLAVSQGWLVLTYPPVPYDGGRNAANRWLRSALNVTWSREFAPDVGTAGTFRAARRMAGLLFPDPVPRRIGVTERNRPGASAKAMAWATPFREEAPAHVRFVGADACADRAPCDALLVWDYRPQPNAPGPPRRRGAYRHAMGFELAPAVFVELYLPRRGAVATP